VLAEGARFEIPTGPETIGAELTLGIASKGLMAESEVVEEAVETDQA
jgi:hypothetical protein